jgi:hypothetical protein
MGRRISPWSNSPRPLEIAHEGGEVPARPEKVEQAGLDSGHLRDDVRERWVYERRGRRVDGSGHQADVLLAKLIGLLVRTTRRSRQKQFRLGSEATVSGRPPRCASHLAKNCTIPGVSQQLREGIGSRPPRPRQGSENAAESFPAICFWFSGTRAGPRPR